LSLLLLLLLLGEILYLRIWYGPPFCHTHVKKIALSPGLMSHHTFSISDQAHEFIISLTNKSSVFFLQANGLLVITVFWLVELVQPDSLVPRAIWELWRYTQPVPPTSPRPSSETVRFSVMDPAVSMVSGLESCTSQRVASDGAYRNPSLPGLNSPK